MEVGVKDSLPIVAGDVLKRGSAGESGIEDESIKGDILLLKISVKLIRCIVVGDVSANDVDLDGKPPVKLQAGALGGKAVVCIGED